MKIDWKRAIVAGIAGTVAGVIPAIICSGWDQPAWA